MKLPKNCAKINEFKHQSMKASAMSQRPSAYGRKSDQPLADEINKAKDLRLTYLINQSTMDIIDLRQKKDHQEEIKPVLAVEPSEPSGIKKAGSFIWEIAKIIIVSLAIIVPIRMFVVQPFIVEGASMSPNFHDGEYLIVDEISYRFAGPQRGDVVIFHPPQSPKVYYIKRIIGLPGETVEIKEGKIYIYNEQHPNGILLNEVDYEIDHSIPLNETEKITLVAGEFYLLGDNRTNSLDSRRIGPISFDHIRGRAWVRAYPFARFSIFETKVYNF